MQLGLELRLFLGLLLAPQATLLGILELALECRPLDVIGIGVVLFDLATPEAPVVVLEVDADRLDDAATLGAERRVVLPAHELQQPIAAIRARERDVHRCHLGASCRGGGGEEQEQYARDKKCSIDDRCSAMRRMIRATYMGRSSATRDARSAARTAYHRRSRPLAPPLPVSSFLDIPHMHWSTYRYREAPVVRVDSEPYPQR